MQLLSTALVVPICQSIAESVQCVYPEGTHWTEALMGNPNDTIYLASTPDVLCFQGHHTMLVLAIFAVLPAYLYILVPYAVCAGDAHYVPSNILFDWKVWEDKNTWWKAAERSATDLHLAFLHPNPREVFRTNILELMAKILLPVVTILLAPNPLVEMIFVFLIGFVMWVACRAKIGCQCPALDSLWCGFLMCLFWKSHDFDPQTAAGFAGSDS